MHHDLKDFYKYFGLHINEITTTGDFIMWFVEEETSEEEPTHQSDIQFLAEQKSTH